MKRINVLLSVLLLSFSCLSAQVKVDISVIPGGAIAGGNILISDEAVNASYEGNGFHYSPYPHSDVPSSQWGSKYGAYLTDKKWALLKKRLDYMKPQTVRMMVIADWHYYQGGRINFDNKIEGIVRFLEYCKENNVTVIFGEFEPPARYSITSEAWIEMASGYLKYLVVDKGFTCIKYYTVVNEPDGDWSAAKGDWELYKQAIVKFNKRLQDIGLADKVKVIGPDAVPRWTNSASQYNGLGWMNESVRQMDDVFGAFVFHDYPSREDAIGESSSLSFYEKYTKEMKTTGKKVYIGELGFKYPSNSPLYRENIRRAEAGYANKDDCNMFVYEYFYGLDMATILMQSMNAGVDGAMAWMLDDSMHSDGYGSLNKLKKWGFWNIFGTELYSDPKEEEIRPWYYTWALLTRYFPRGSEILKASVPPAKGISCVVSRDGDDYTIAIVNTTYSNYKYNVGFAKEIPVKDYKLYTYTNMHRPVDEDGLPVVDKMLRNLDFKKGVELEVPAFGFILLTTKNY